MLRIFLSELNYVIPILTIYAFIDLLVFLVLKSDCNGHQSSRHHHDFKTKGKGNSFLSEIFLCICCNDCVYCLSHWNLGVLTEKTGRATNTLRE